MALSRSQLGGFDQRSLDMLVALFRKRHTHRLVGRAFGDGDPGSSGCPHHIERGFTSVGQGSYLFKDSFKLHANTVTSPCNEYYVSSRAGALAAADLQPALEE